MKRFAKIITLIVVLVAVLAVSAFAADFEHCADALKDMGLFQGTSKGYELDRAPNRAEAATMLVRLLGQEEAAKELEYTAPFTDVQDWAKPYVQYLYDNGLTNGKTATTFGYSDKCTAQQYATFLLRALGYSDAEDGDFTYADALKFAEEKGVADAVNCDPENFLRDDVVAMSYTALATAPKSGEADLLTKLVKDGAVKDAKGYDDLFALYREYAAAAQGDSEETKMSLGMDIDLSMKMSGVDFMSGTIAMDMAADMNAEKMDQSKMAYTADVEMAVDAALAESMGLTEEESKVAMAMKYYYTDGYFYMEMDGEKVKMPMSFDDVMAQMDGITETSSAEPISVLKSLTKSTSGGTTTYSVTYATGAFNSLVDMIMDMVPAEDLGDAAMEFTALSMDVAVRNDNIQSITMKMGMKMTAEGETVEINMDMTMDDFKTGSAVTVTLPSDLSSYQEIIGGAAA